MSSGAPGRADRTGAGSTGDRSWQERRPQRQSAPREDSRPSWRDRRPADGAAGARGRGRPDPRRDEGRSRREQAGGDRPARVPLPAGPELPEWVDPRDLDPAVRASLRGLDPRNADKVAGHLVAAGTLVDEEPETALAHARAARDRASRVAVVREAVGVAAYHAGDYAEAARELRAYRRMSGDAGYRAVLADCERALGRPEVALRLALESLAEGPDPEETVELRLVEAGARRDLGEAAAARLVLEDLLGRRARPEDLDGTDAGRLRVAVAYADLLRAEHQDDLAERWTEAVAEHAPELLEGRLDVAFGEVEVAPDPTGQEPALPTAHGSQPVAGEPADEPAPAPTFEEEVEAEVAELLGEDVPGETPADDTRH